MQRRVLTRKEIKLEEEFLSQQQSIIDRFHPPQLFVKGDIVRSREEPYKDRVFEVEHIKGPILHLHIYSTLFLLLTRFQPYTASYNSSL